MKKVVFSIRTGTFGELVYSEQGILAESDNIIYVDRAIHESLRGGSLRPSQRARMHEA